MGNIVVASPNQAAVISGPSGTRTIIGSSGWAWWCINKTERLSLELMTMSINSTQAETTKGVRVNVGSVAQIKVRALMEGEGQEPPQRRKQEYDMNSIHLAAQHFLGDSETNIRDAIQRTMEGHQRQILGTLTVEEIYKDRAAFSERVREHVHEDLAAMGFQLVSYTVTNIDDTGGYMESLGATQTALVKREAAEGRARNEAEARKKVAAYKAEADIAEATSQQEAHVSVMSQKELEAEANRDLQMKQASYNAQVNTANAEAAAAGRIETAKQDQEVVRATTQQHSVEAEIRIQIAEREALRVQKEREGISLGELVVEENRAKGVRVKADAEASRIRSIGDAEAAAVQAKGEAEATVLEKKAEAFKQYGEAALVQMIVEKLPEIAESVAAPLSKADKMVFVSQDGAAGSMMTGDINRIVAQLPATVEGLTGVDITKLLKRTAEGKDTTASTVSM